MSSLSVEFNTRIPLGDEAMLEQTDKQIESSTNWTQARVAEIIRKVALLTPPQFSLRDMVAVNPFLGYVNLTICDAQAAINFRLGANVLPSLKDLSEFYTQGRFERRHVVASIAEYAERHTDSTPIELTVDQIIQRLVKGGAYDQGHKDSVSCNHLMTLAAWIDEQGMQPGKWKNDVVVDISRFCSGRFDQGVSRVSTFSDEAGIFAAWKAYAKVSRAMYARGLKGFNKFIQTLPSDYELAISGMLKSLKITDANVIENYLAALLGEIPGWAGFLRQRGWQKAHSDIGEVGELLAIRLAYDLAFLKDNRTAVLSKPWIYEILQKATRAHVVSGDDKIRGLAMRAFELSYRESIQQKLSEQPSSRESIRASAQIVFCIDVRSELMHRHLAAVSASIETYGFAGFFGLPIELGSDTASLKTSKHTFVAESDVREINSAQPQCPVLLTPQFLVARQSQEAALRNGIIDSVASSGLKAVLKSFSRAANSCFTYVETVGFLSFFDLLRGLVKNSQIHAFGGQNKTRDHNANYQLVSADRNQRVALAVGILKNLGLRAPYARVVVFCGHESTAANNPQGAALACGACAGHSGAPNAKVAALLLNDPEVRTGLLAVGLKIPEDTIFVAAVHDTATDDVSFLDAVPDSHRADLERIKFNVTEASQRVREERTTKLSFDYSCSSDAVRYRALVSRSQDISEVRPEWALAGNATFIAAKSEAVRGINFEGRSFLHNYDRALDADGSVLETILTAPVVVASWINLQYLGSSVDPVHFGSGFKTLHNISAGVGVICGNDGDLAPGLSFQSVHDGTKSQHEPLRLQVFVQAAMPAIDLVLAKHLFLMELVKNEWIHLYSLSDDARLCQLCIGDRWTRAW